MGERRTVIPFGPQHPVLPEAIQLKLVIEDEKIVEAVPQIGYIHRGLERLVKIRDFHQMVFVAERVCGICSFQHALSYCLGIERLMNIEVPERAAFLRVIWAELHRLHSHLLWLGLLADAFGFETLFMEAWKIREAVLDMMEATAGSRIIISTCQVGGTRRDISPELLQAIIRLTDRIEGEVKAIEHSVVNDYTIRQRTVGIGVIEKEQARKLGVVGPMLRGSGIKWDARMLGYAAYKHLEFEPVVETAGDCYARTVVRFKEIFLSLDLLRQAIAKIPAGEINVPVKGNPQGEVLIQVEQPRGEVIYTIKANGTKNLERMHVRTPTFANLPALLTMLPGYELADVPILILSIDPCISCTER
jgi:Ni,Fe-hydrogenase III large subunit